MKQINDDDVLAILRQNKERYYHAMLIVSHYDFKTADAKLREWLLATELEGYTLSGGNGMVRLLLREIEKELGLTRNPRLWHHKLS